MLRHNKSFFPLSQRTVLLGQMCWSDVLVRWVHVEDIMSLSKKEEMTVNYRQISK